MQRTGMAAFCAVTISNAQKLRISHQKSEKLAW
jgi:hypothetical protein